MLQSFGPRFSQHFGCWGLRKTWRMLGKWFDFQLLSPRFQHFLANGRYPGDGGPFRVLSSKDALFANLGIGNDLLNNRFSVVCVTHVATYFSQHFGCWGLRKTWRMLGKWFDFQLLSPRFQHFLANGRYPGDGGPFRVLSSKDALFANLGIGNDLLNNRFSVVCVTHVATYRVCVWMDQ